MKKITKRILIASAVTAGTGVVFMGVGIALGGWPHTFSELFYLLYFITISD